MRELDLDKFGTDLKFKPLARLRSFLKSRLGYCHQNLGLMCQLELGTLRDRAGEQATNQSPGLSPIL